MGSTSHFCCSDATMVVRPLLYFYVRFVSSKRHVLSCLVVSCLVITFYIWLFHGQISLGTLLVFFYRCFVLFRAVSFQLQLTHYHPQQFMLCSVFCWAGLVRTECEQSASCGWFTWITVHHNNKIPPLVLFTYRVIFFSFLFFFVASNSHRYCLIFPLTQCLAFYSVFFLKSARV